MPTLVGAVLDSMLVAARCSPASTLSFSNTTAEPVRCPMALRRDPAIAAADVLLAEASADSVRSSRRWRPRVIPEVTWRALDPYGMTVRDIDTPADLG